MKLIIGLLALALLAACETTAPITPTATMKPALAERLAVLNTDEPMPPAEGPEDVAPGPAQDPNRNPGLVPSPLLRFLSAYRWLFCAFSSWTCLVPSVFVSVRLLH